MKSAFTFIEIVIVLAVTIALSSIIVPNLLSSLEKSRLRADVQTVMIMQNAAELYRMEAAGPLNEAEDAAALLSELKANGYLTEIDAAPGLKGADWSLNADGKLRLDISLCEPRVKVLAAELSERERAYIK